MPIVSAGNIGRHPIASNQPNKIMYKFDFDSLSIGNAGGLTSDLQLVLGVGSGIVEGVRAHISGYSADWDFNLRSVSGLNTDYDIDGNIYKIDAQNGVFSNYSINAPFIAAGAARATKQIYLNILNNTATVINTLTLYLIVSAPVAPFQSVVVDT